MFLHKRTTLTSISELVDWNELNTRKKCSGSIDVCHSEQMNGIDSVDNNTKQSHVSNH